MKSRCVYGGHFLGLMAIVFLLAHLTGPSHANESTGYEDFRNFVSPCRLLLQGNVPAEIDREGRWVPKGIPADRFEMIESEAIKFQSLLDNALRVVENQEDALSRNILAAAMGQNHLIVGDPGAAKSFLVYWQFGGLDLWSIQLNPWTTLDEIIGGISKEDFEAGRASRRNTRGGALEAEFTLFDELSNSNPAVRTSVLSLANPGERFVMIEGRPFYAKTRVMLATGNASFYEIIKSVDEEGKAGQGQAFMNRWLFKTTLSAWLPSHAQERRDENIRRQNYLKHLLKYGTPEQRTQAKEELKGYQPTDFNYQILDYLSEQAFVMDPLLEKAARDLATNLKTEMDREVFRSYGEGRINQDPSFIPFESATEWSERVRTVIPQLIKTSAAMDLMRLPSQIRTRLLKKGPINLTTASLWRLRYLIRGAPGHAFFDPKTAQIHFNLKREHETIQSHNGKTRVRTRGFYYAPTDVRELAQNARTTRNKTDWEHMLKEQEMFNRLIQPTLEEATRIHKLLAAIPQIGSGGDVDDDVQFESGDFENLIYNLDKPHIDRLRPAPVANPVATANADGDHQPKKP